MLRVLFIDDEPTSVDTVIEELKENIGPINCKQEVFDNTKSALADFLPDVVVLDIFRGGASPDGDTVGLDDCNFIWDNCFCPIIVYSAQPDIVLEKIKTHPFIQSVQKGSGSEAKVISHIREFLPHIEALKVVQNDIRQHVNRELGIIAPMIFDKIDDGKRKDVFSRAVRRRVAAMMDEPSDEPIACWEQYLYPPVGDVLLTGDIIRKSKGTITEPCNYYIILTPSCDLVPHKGKTPKVDRALVASCTGVEKILLEVGAEKTTRANKLKDKLLPLLKRGYGSYSMPLPEFPDILPAMVAELKQLELIEISRIGTDDKSEYHRVVSVDSPFREMITWAYVQIIGRPGLPERDFDTWANEICLAIRSIKTKGGGK